MIRLNMRCKNVCDLFHAVPSLPACRLKVPVGFLGNCPFEEHQLVVLCCQQFTAGQQQTILDDSDPDSVLHSENVVDLTESGDDSKLSVSPPLELRDDAYYLDGIDYNTWRPAPMGQGVRLRGRGNGRRKSRSMPLPHHEHQRNYADVLVEKVLADQGLGRYADPNLIRTTQLEIAEAYNMTEAQMHSAARSLMQRSPKYFEHMGGQRPADIKDFNQYSKTALLKPREINSSEEVDISDDMNMFMSVV
ncbi:hypothetical protein D917_09050 [Trichinella nativa]|uniref:Uncharacterized protein n=1 Tax=Trichinella nativa TaxID=6335 RepID=A0A1Y3EH63_9BILA|nr:hypothetical protein D917_09050 [Trichinella nativa]